MATITKVLYRNQKSTVFRESQLDTPYIAFAGFNNTADLKRTLLRLPTSRGTFTATVDSTPVPYITSVVTSVSSPGWHVKKPVHISWVPKKHPLKPPVKPVLRLPKKPKLRYASIGTPRPISKLPPFGPRTSRKLMRYLIRRHNRAYARYLVRFQERYEQYVRRCVERYELRLSRWKDKVARCERNFSLRMEKYEARMKRYLFLVQLMKNGYTRMRRVSAKRSVTVRNPYTRVLTTDFGVKGCVYSITRNLTSSGYATSPTGGWIYNREIILLSDHSWKNTFGYYSTPTVRSSSVAACDSQLLAKLRRKRDDQVAHIGNMLAERAQTFSMLRSILLRFLALKANPIGSLRYIWNMSASKKVRQISDDFLAFQFGLRPLIQDVYNLFQAIAEPSKAFPDRVVIRARGSASDTDIQTAGGNPHIEVAGVIHNGSWNGEVIHSMETTTTISYVLEYQVTNGALSNLQKFGLVNPLEIAWEVMPWSFVIDWFLPIGDYIRSLSAPSALTFVGGTKVVTTYTKIDSKCVYNPAKQTGVVAQIESGYISGSYAKETKTRTVLSTAPCALPQLDFKNPISTYHILELIALLVQRSR